MARTSVFQPDLYLKKIEDLPKEDLYAKGYRNILIDLDNTLAPYYEKDIDERSKKILDDLVAAGFYVVVLSNNHGPRVRRFLEGTDYHFLDTAMKPLKCGYKRLLKEKGLKAEETMTIGDQILTDVLGANRMGMYSILVHPLVDKDSLNTRVNRIFERYLIRKGIIEL